MKKPSFLILPIITCLTLVSCNQEEKATSASEPTVKDNAEQVSETASTLPSETEETCRTLGQYFAISTNLHELNFSDAEKAAIVEGFSKGLEGGHDANFMQDNVSSVSAFLQERHMAKSSIESKENKAAAAAFIEELKKEGEATFTESGLGYVIVKPGEAEKPTKADAVSVNYRGTLIDGTVFDEAMDPENPVTFPLGGVIPGFSEGLQLVGKGGEVRLYIPSDLGYGDNPRPGGPIKAGAMLIFDVTIQDIQKPDLPKAEDLPPPPPIPEEVPAE